MVRSFRKQWRARAGEWRQRPGYVPHFSLSPPAYWFSFRLVPALVRFFPHLVWRLPAALLACGDLLFDADGRRLSAALSRAVGNSHGRVAHVWLHWRRCYQREAELLIAVQSARLTPEWASAHIPCDSTPPAGGAVLVAPHHSAQVLGLLALSGRVKQLGAVFAAPPATVRDDVDHTVYDPTFVELARYGRPVCDRAFGPWAFEPHEVGRRGLKFLRDGGYFSITGDDFYGGTARYPLLGRTLTFARGAVWLAQQSGKPIVPYMVIPWRGGWRLWIGEPVPSTQAGVIAALEAGIRRAPESWTRTMAMVWRDAPVWSESDGEAGE